METVKKNKHGGKRTGAGRKKDFIADFSTKGDRKPRSIYCSGVEFEQIKTFLHRKRAIKILQNYEPGTEDNPNPNHYRGTHEEWERDYESIRTLDLETMDAMQDRIAEIIAKCERADD